MPGKSSQKKTIHPEIPNGCNLINAPLWKRKLLYLNSRLSWIFLFDAWKKFQQIFSPIEGLDGETSTEFLLKNLSKPSGVNLMLRMIHMEVDHLTLYIIV